jgi:2-polyprenyl-3-methyl-5-hydroxy-6-metoxy-1,4-benzoquinol methylase
MAQNDYIDKKITYFSNARLDIISLIPNNPAQIILEIGAGGGDTLIEIKKRGLAKEVVGVELMALKGTNQTHNLIDSFIFIDLDREKLSFKEEYFDVIILGDVLEHLINPWEVVETLSVFLKKGGIIVMSLPNIRDITALYKIVVRGDFAYNPDGGILDKTHMRFFCKKNAIDLLTTENLTVKKVEPISSKNKNGKNLRSIVNKLSLGIFEEFITSQYLVVSQKKL